MWKYNTAQLNDWYIKYLNSTEDELARNVVINDPENFYEVITSYFNDMNNYAFNELKNTITDENEEYPVRGRDDYSFQSMKERIIKLERKYAYDNKLTQLGICPDKQINYLAKTTSDWYSKSTNI